MRYFFIGYHWAQDERREVRFGLGTLLIQSERFPSIKQIGDIISSLKNESELFSILSIQELPEKDYIDFTNPTKDNGE